MIKGDKSIKVITNNVIRQLGDEFRVNPLGIRLERFLDKPTLLRNHSYDDNIGLWDLETMVITKDYIEMTPLFSVTENEMATKYEEGLYAASISFEFNTDNDVIISEDGIYNINGCDLIEVSLVSVPADGKAIKNKFQYKGHKDKKLSNIMKFMLEEKDTDTIENANEVIETEVSKDVNEVEVELEKVIETESIEVESNVINEIENKETEKEIELNKIIDELKNEIENLTKGLLEKENTLKEFSNKIESFELKVKEEAELKLKKELDNILDEYNVEPAKREIYFSLGIEKTKEVFSSLPNQAKKGKVVNDNGIINFLNQKTTEDNVLEFDYFKLNSTKEGIAKFNKLKESNPFLAEQIYRDSVNKRLNKK